MAEKLYSRQFLLFVTDNDTSRSRITSSTYPYVLADVLWVIGHRGRSTIFWYGPMSHVRRICCKKMFPHFTDRKTNKHVYPPNPPPKTTNLQQHKNKTITTPTTQKDLPHFYHAETMTIYLLI